MPGKKTSNAKLVDRQLERYRSMRNFGVTPEPSGAGSKGGSEERAGGKEGLPFVIQKHAASRLHYDFRLGWNGVLKSWAVPKGPSYVPREKHLAAQVEDHPIEYGGFEGTIPADNYGGGTVMVWDTGTWEPQPGHTDVDAGLRDGSLKFTLHGEKMKGKWALVRMGGKAAKEAKPNWLLIKEHDEFERSEGEPEITVEMPDSVITGRSLEQIAGEADHTWGGSPAKEAKGRIGPARATGKGVSGAGVVKKQTGGDKARAGKKSSEMPAAQRRGAPPRGEKVEAAKLETAPKEELPKFVAPQLATLASKPPEEAGWLHELKLDGYRIQARKEGDSVVLLTRTGLDWTHRMGSVAKQIARLPARSALLDGEMVVLDGEGNTSFAKLQAAFQEHQRQTLSYFIFDLLHLDGHNLRGLGLVDRKAMLAGLLAELPEDCGDLHFGEHIEGNGAEVFKNACRLHAEGIISKRSTGGYTSGRSQGWLKLKCAHQQEFVVGGYTISPKGSHGVGALLLGYYDERGKLVYAGRTGTGFTRQLHAMLLARLDKLKAKANPFEAMPSTAKAGAIWVKPQLVAEVNFATWTAEGLLRQAAFKGLREDKPAGEVGRESPGAAVDTSSKGEKELRVDDGDQSKAFKKKSDLPLAKERASRGDANPPVIQGRLTHPDKVVDPSSGVTKRQLWEYYLAIAEYLLPHVVDRPVSIVRCPDGSESACFFQKHRNAMLPAGVGSIDVPDKKTGKVEPYITVSSAEALASLAQIGVLELHPWSSKQDDLEHPDRIIMDLDPDEAISWKTLAAAALEVRAVLKKVGVESFLKSTGGKGLHIVVPFVPEHSWESIKTFAHEVALQMERSNPALYLSRMSKQARKGKIYVDYLRNERGATSIAAFSPRSRRGLPVSIPLHWAQLKQEARPLVAVVDFAEWKAGLKRNPWKDFFTIRQRLKLKLPDSK